MRKRGGTVTTTEASKITTLELNLVMCVTVPQMLVHSYFEDV